MAVSYTHLMGKAGNSLGGYTFQFSDGWWKYGQTKNLDVHDANASWSNGGYFTDYNPGDNNMNEEWFGICAKGPTNAQGLYKLYPRAAYYALKQAHSLNPFQSGMNSTEINKYFTSINLADAELKARGDKAAFTIGTVSYTHLLPSELQNLFLKEMYKYQRSLKN